jgi:hypothetical protein
MTLASLLRRGADALDPRPPRVVADGLDVEEVGRRLRAVYVAMNHLGPHEACLARYEIALRELYPPETNEPKHKGSWGWWAAKLLEPTP